MVLARAEAFRFALSVKDRPPRRFGDWAEAVEEAGRCWSAWAEDRTGAMPNLVAAEWEVFCQGADVPLEEVELGRAHRLCEAPLTLHAVADEASAGLGVALDSSGAEGIVYRACGRELLARTGSLARIDARFLRVLPKVITPPTGRLAFSRDACVQGPGIGARWHKIPARHRGTDLRSEYATILLLPWPLRVYASDFHPVGSVQRLGNDRYGFFEFAPAVGLDLDLLDRVLVAARLEAGSVDVVLLPESAVDVGEVDDLETLLHHHGVVALVAGVRQPMSQPSQFPSNWLHMGFNTRLEKGGLPSEKRDPWFHIRQDKHHRWSLDDGQVEQYHLGAALHPHIRWWEAMDVPRKAIQFVEVAELVLTSLVCEDLAHNDEIAQLIRSVGPTMVMNVLLDGPQLTSRWTARYASVLADDPGSAVLTLTSYGMAGRSRPHGRDASAVIALWKDPTQGVREIPLEPGAHGVLLTVSVDRATRYSADLRRPVDNSTSFSGVAVCQVRASSAASRGPQPPSTTPTAPVLELDALNHPHGLGGGRIRSRGIRARAHRPAARGGVPRRDMAGRARPPGALPPTCRRHRIARPNRSSGPLTSRWVVVRRLARDSQSRPPLRNRPRPGGPADVAIDARGAADQATNRSQWHTLSGRRRGHRMSHSGRVRVGLAGRPSWWTGLAYERPEYAGCPSPGGGRPSNNVGTSAKPSPAVCGTVV